MTGSTNHIAVSIIVPVYNVAPFLEETIQSILTQSLQEFELILVNDGSTDESALICQEYLSKDKRIQFIDQKNSGVSIARNNGLLQAKGEYVFFMDSDDTIDPEFIKSSYNTGKMERADIVVLGEFYTNQLPDIMALPTCGQMLRMEFLLDHPEIRFPEGLQPCEDGLFSHQLLALTTRIAANPDAMYNYRSHENQNHHRIHDNCWAVLRQIPTWFLILENFYNTNKFFTSHSQHLALFVEHEPFGLRYLGLPLDTQQKHFLFELIRKFMADHVNPYLSEVHKSEFSEVFQYFLNAKDHVQFDRYYQRYLKRRANKKKLLLFLVKLMPVSGLRRNWRQRIREKY